MKKRFISGINKIKNFCKENKKITIIIGIAIIVIGLVLGCVCIWKNRKLNHEEQLITYLKDMGKDFYENSYYNQLGKDEETRTKFLEKYSTIGIKIDLENLSRYGDGKNKEIIEKFVNEKNGLSCHKTKTRVVIYPVSPYGSTDYKIETDLYCSDEDTQEQSEMDKSANN